MDRIIQYTHTKKKKRKKGKRKVFDFLWTELRRTLYGECETMKVTLRLVVLAKFAMGQRYTIYLDC